MSDDETSEFNQFPDGWRELTEAQFSRSAFFTYAPERREMRQMHPEPGTNDPARLAGEGERRTAGVAMQATLYHFADQTGVALVSEYWRGKVRFFAFGCDHAFEDLDDVHGDRRLKCPKCGLVTYRPDSSG